MNDGNKNGRDKWSPVKNVSDDECPAFGVMASSGKVDPASGSLEVMRPNAKNQTVWVNDGLSISPGGHGNGTQDTEVRVAYDETDGDPAPGQEWGVSANSWLIRKNSTGFRITSPGVAGLVNAVRTATNFQTCCATTGDNPTTVPVGCAASGSGSGSSPPPPPPGACLFGKDPCLDYDSDAVWTPVNISGTYYYGPCVPGSLRLAGSDKTAAFAACGNNATIKVFQSWTACGFSGAQWGLCDTSADNPLIDYQFAQKQCVTIFNGTRSYVDALPATVVNTTFDGYQFPVSATIGRVQVAGSLVMCPGAEVPWFYLKGTIRSTAADPSNVGVYDCGCLSVVGGCNTDANGVTQTVYTDGDGHKILRVTTLCGVVEFAIGTCPPPPPPPPPPSGYNCIGGFCQPSTSGPGTYPDLATCLALPCSPPPPPPPPLVPVGYDCIGYTCSPVYSPATATFPDFATCVASPGCSPPPPSPCCTTALDGTVMSVAYSGSSSGLLSCTWTIPGTGSATGGMSTTFVVEGNTFRAVCLSDRMELWRWNSGNPTPGVEPPDSTSSLGFACPNPSGGPMSGVFFTSSGFLAFTISW